LIALLAGIAMKIPEVKKLVDNMLMEELVTAEKAFVAWEKLPIAVQGNKEGKQLSLILAAIFIEEIDFNTAIHEYTRRVRESIF
jgi:hypothetical protein